MVNRKFVRGVSYFAAETISIDPTLSAQTSYLVPLVHGVTGSLALVLPGLDDGKAGTRDTEHLSLNELPYRRVAGPNRTYANHDGVGKKGLEGDGHGRVGAAWADLKVSARSFFEGGIELTRSDLSSGSVAVVVGLPSGRALT